MTFNAFCGKTTVDMLCSLKDLSFEKVLKLWLSIIARYYSMDLSIFENITISCSDSDNCKDCPFIQRLLNCLKYYTQLNLTENIDNQTIFCDFVNEIYKYQIYEDYFHLTKFHSSHLNSVRELAIKSYQFENCNLTTCNYSNRHFRVNTKTISFNMKESKYIQIHMETMDSLHFYLFHLEQAGLRQYGNCVEPVHEDKAATSSSPYFDENLSRISDGIKESQKVTNRFTRLSGNKYNISAVIDNDDISKGDDTFLDASYKYLLSVSSEIKDTVMRLMEIIRTYDYDTDTVDLDLGIYEDDGISNISMELKSEPIMNKLMQKFKESKSYVFIYVFAQFVISHGYVGII